MKSLLEFKSIVEEEKSDYSKFDTLVRAGLANKAQMQRIHKILDKMQEDKPVFNNADRAILQNLFNKMVDLISNNKAINIQARRAVREELEEDVIDTADVKISPSGRKIRAHKIKVGDKVEESLLPEDEVEQLDEITKDNPADPPYVILLKRKAIRVYPDKTKVALYHNAKLDKYFSVPYGPTVPGGTQPLQSESVQIEESVMDQLHKIVKNKQADTVNFGNGKKVKVDGYTASAITKVHGALNDENKKKIADMVHKSPEHFQKVASFAFSKVK